MRKTTTLILLATLTIVLLPGVEAACRVIDAPFEQSNIQFRAEFNKEGNIDSHELTYGGAATVEAEQITANPSQVFLFEPTSSFLPDGEYHFEVTATDTAFGATTLTDCVNFTVDSPATDIWVQEPGNSVVDRPDFGTATQQPFRLELATERPATCRFDRKFGDTPDNLQDFYQELAGFQLDSTDGGLTHYVDDFRFSDYMTSYQEPDMVEFVAVCNEEQNEAYSYEVISLNIDSTPLVIEAKDANPDPVIDPRSRETTITVQTDDRSVCEVIPEEYPSSSTEPSVLDNPVQNATGYQDYVKNHDIEVEFESTQAFTYGFQIRCENTAGSEATDSITVEMAPQRLQNITIDSPEGITNQQQTEVRIGVVRATDTCYARIDEGSFQELQHSEGSFTEDGFSIHTGTYSGVGDGEHSVEAYCQSEPNLRATKTFTKDTTPPQPPTINTYDLTCGFNPELSVTADEETELTGIDTVHFNFTADTISGQNDLSQYNTETRISSSNPWTTQQSISDEMNGSQYMIFAWATDNAGNTGIQRSKRITVTTTDDPRCDRTPPTITVDKDYNNTERYYKVNVSCEDDGSGCKPFYDYGKLPVSAQSCQVPNQGNLNAAFLVRDTSLVCSAVYDNNENEANNSQIMEIGAVQHCTNNEEDADETDVDCGGASCAGCGPGKSCGSTSDCNVNLGLVCDAGTCQDPPDHCENGEKDVERGETGVDCGGPNCLPCEDEAECFTASDCLSGVCTNNTCQTPTCSDGVRNGDETGVDCGGSCNAICENPPGSECTRDDQCQDDLVCIDNECSEAPDHCSNEVQDEDEVGVDCGGSCEACDADGEIECEYDFECDGDQVCDVTTNTCIAPPDHCSNEVQDEDEVGVDCGGSCNACDNDEGSGCENTLECSDGLQCIQNQCQAPPNHCVNDVQDEDETGVDCGGSCEDCPGEETDECLVDRDCAEGLYCAADKTCQELVGHCSNGVQDEDEAGVDCGGDDCRVCEEDNPICGDYTECEEGQVCEANQCIVPPDHCSNGVQDQDETGVDCGGSSCRVCKGSKVCGDSSECGVDEECYTNRCVVPTCNDNRKNGGEADVDCGEVCTVQCSTGDSCVVDTDCASGNCQSGTCAEASCTNDKIDGEETGLNCGGSVCGACPEDTRCNVDSDCETNYCSPEGTCDTPPDQDTDGDGLPDNWEEEHSGDPTAMDPDADPDSDGYTNEDEYEADTDPNDASSNPGTPKDGTEPTPQDEPPSTVGLVFLTLGFLLVVSGVGILVYEEYYIEEGAPQGHLLPNNNGFSTPEPRENPTDATPSFDEPLPEEEPEVDPFQEEHSSVMSAFDDEDDFELSSTNFEEQPETKQTMNAGSAPQQPTNTVADTPPIDDDGDYVDLSAQQQEDFVDLDTVNTEKDDEKDVFDELDELQDL